MLPVAGDPDTFKQTNEIKIAAPLLQPLDIQDKDITADALLTQREFAQYLLGRGARYHFTVKDNQPTLLADLQLYFKTRSHADYVEISPPTHGRIETRSIWVTEALNGYLQFPHVGQAYLLERHVVHKKSGKESLERAYGLTSRPATEASPERLLKVNRGHWTIENRSHYVIDWNFEEDRGRIRTGFGPQNVSRLRRFAVCLIQSKAGRQVAETLRLLNRKIRLVFDYLLMSENSRRTSPKRSTPPAAAAAPA